MTAAPPLYPRRHRKILTILVTLVGLMACVAAAWFHWDMRVATREQNEVRGDLRRLRSEITKGYLRTVLGREDQGSFDPQSAYLRMNQGLGDFQKVLRSPSVKRWATSDVGKEIAALEASVQRLQVALNSSDALLARLSVSMHELERDADRLDVALEKELNRLLEKDHRQFYLMLAASVALLILALLDTLWVARRERRAIDAIRVSEDRLHRVINSISEGLIITDGNGKVLHWNQALVRMHGCQIMADFVRRHEFLELADESGPLSFSRWPLQRLIAGEEVKNLELKVTHRVTSERRVLLFNGSVVQSMEEQPLYYLWIIDVTEQRKTAEEVRRQRIELQALFDLVPAFIWYKDTENRIVRVNQRVADAAGLPIHEIEGKRCEELYPDHASVYFADDLAVMKTRQPRYGIVEPIRKGDGTVRWIRTDKVPYLNAQGEIVGIVVSAQDITEQKKAETVLREQARLLAEMGHLAKVGGWGFDPVTGEGEWTDEVAIIHDLDPRVSVSKEVGLQFYTPSSRPIITAAVEAAIQHGTPYDLELEIVSAKGVRKWVRTIARPVVEHGRVTKVQGAFQDITERKRLAVRLAAQNRVSHLLAESRNFAEVAGQVLGILADVERWDFGAIWLVAPSGEELLCEEVWLRPGKSYERLIERTRALTFNRGVGLPGRVWEGAAPLVIPDVRTDPRYLRQHEAIEVGLLGAVGFPVIWDGRVVGVIDFLGPEILSPDESLDALMAGIGRQLGVYLKRWQMGAELQQINTSLERRVVQRTSQLEEANKELEAFSYSVSHDLRAPLRAVDGFSQALQEDFEAELSSEARRYLQIIRSETQRMGQLIDDLLAFSRLNRASIDKRPVEVSRMVGEILESYQETVAARGVIVSMAALPPCCADPSLLRQVWINLLSNAFKYTSKATPPRIEIGGQVVDGTVEYYVKDNGAGFDMKYVHKLFGVFQRLHRPDEYEGTGVGLAIVQRIVHRHGGSVRAEGKPNEGACFTFTMSDIPTAS